MGATTAIVRGTVPFMLATLLAAGCGGSTGQPNPEAAPPVSAAPARSDPGGVIPEPSTFHSLAVRRPVRGDANANAEVHVRYRRRGDDGWRQALPLIRVNPEGTEPENRVPGGWLFAGSIFDLAPDTDYEVALALRDPDGGDSDRSLLLRTIGEPAEPAGMRLRHVVPTAGADGRTGSGTPDNPFHGLKAAQASAEPGDLFLLHAGVYAEGTWRIERHGTGERPIIYRGAGDGQTILDGGAASGWWTLAGCRTSGSSG